MYLHRIFSFIRTITVGTGITPVLLTLRGKALAGLLYLEFISIQLTAGRESHPAPRISGGTI
jgi:hypothetical protein